MRASNQQMPPAPAQGQASPGHGHAPLIIVAGNIGAGKSTASAALARELGLRLLPEPFEENPHLDDYYRDPVAFGYRTQRWFIETELARQPGIAARRGVVQDRAIYEKAEVFVPVMAERGELSPAEVGELTRLYERSIARVPDPDLLVYVELPESRCAARIAARGRAAERGIGLDYLAALERAYERFSTSWARSPVVRLDALSHDPREPDAVRHLAARVRAALGAPARPGGAAPRRGGRGSQSGCLRSAARSMTVKPRSRQSAGRR